MNHIDIQLVNALLLMARRSQTNDPKEINKINHTLKNIKLNIMENNKLNSELKQTDDKRYVRDIIIHCEELSASELKHIYRFINKWCREDNRITFETVNFGISYPDEQKNSPTT